MNKLKINFVIVLLLFLLNNSFAQNPDTAMQVIKSGKGQKSIIFIPGFACSGEVWNETKTNLEQNFVCYTLTMPGFASAKPQFNPSFKTWEKNIADFIKKNNIVKPIVFGHSMGGGLALALASDYPDLIEKIIVVDALPCLAALSNPAFKQETNPDCSAMTDRLVNATQEQFYAMQKATIFRLVADTSMQQQVLNWSKQSDRNTMAKMYCDFTNTDLRESIAKVTCPALVLLQSYFINFKPAIDEQYKNLSTAKLLYATKGLHFIMYDDKAWYFNQISNFISVN